MIVVDSLHKSFKTKTGLVKAVNGVSFNAADGQITGLLGPNGAGKTTTLRMLYTLMTPDQGRCQGPGRALRGQPDRCARVYLVQRMGTMSRTDHATEAHA